MKWIRKVLLPGLLLCWLGLSQAQVPPLPGVQGNRRGDRAYMDSLSRVGKQRLRTLASLPQTARIDTLRFETLYWLGIHYRQWAGRKDSTLYFTDLLTNLARQRRNTKFEVRGLLLTEYYHHTIAPNNPEALRLNFDVLKLLKKKDSDPRASLDVDRNLGDLYSLAGDNVSARRYLDRARTILITNSVVGPPIQVDILIDIEQNIATTYYRQDNFTESERHYLKAVELLSGTQSKIYPAYVYGDLAELYLRYERYEQALIYAKKAESIWIDRRGPGGEQHNVAMLACAYAGLGQDELAHEYAQKVLTTPQIGSAARQLAYRALYQVFEHRQDWQQGSLYYKKYSTLRDTMRLKLESNKLAALQKQAELDQLALQSEQARQLQAEHLRTVQKQAELDQLRNDLKADTLTKKALLAEQQRLVEKERATALLARQQTRQKLQQQAYRQQLAQQQRTRSLLLAGLAGVLLFTLVLGVVYQKNRMQKRQIAQLNAGLEQTVQIRTSELQAANDELRQKNQVLKEADTRIITAQEVERQRIAADLHDDLGGTLATLSRKITDGWQQFPQIDVRLAFGDLEPLIRKSSDDLRRISHNLMPPEFARIGLRSALDQLVNTLPKQPTRFEFLSSGPEQRLPVAIELNLYRIVSELIHNILKHAQAKQASVQLLYHNDQLSVIIEDNGVGISAKRPVLSDGIGLKNSTFRADYIGATLRRETSNGGTLFLLELPYAPTHALYSLD